MELKQSNKYEVQVPRDEKFIQIPVHKWESLKIEVNRIDPTDPIIPGFIGGLLGFWLSTLIFGYLFFKPNSEQVTQWIAALFLLWLGSFIAYLIIYTKQRALVGNMKDELKEIINDVDK
ncbi:MAG: hypothetical protein WB392_02455 [Methanotrichaceae archaeon]